MTLPLEDDDRPPYMVAAEDLRRQIKAGTLKPGERMPSARDLQARYGLASSTVQNALKLLKDEGLIYSVLGRGSYVRPQPRPLADPVADAEANPNHPHAVFQRQYAARLEEMKATAAGRFADEEDQEAELAGVVEAGGETVEVSAADLATLVELVRATQAQVSELQGQMHTLAERVERAEQAGR